MSQVPITVVILTYNEEDNLPACLGSVARWVAEIVIVDSGSGDRTREIARDYGARVVEHPFETHARQWQWALEELPLATEWVLGLDADQRVTPELREELITLFAGTGQDAGKKGGRKQRLPSSLSSNHKHRDLDEVDGFYVKRRQIFRGRWIRHGGYYPKYLLKLFRRDAVHVDGGDLIDHHFYVSGDVAKLEGDIVEANRKEDDIDFWIEKHKRYARLLAEEELLRRENGMPIQPRIWGSPDERTAWLKQRWYGLPLYVRPILYFIYRYLLRLGFLDGKQGFIFHFLQGLWYRLLVDIHLDELTQQQRGG